MALVLHAKAPGSVIFTEDDVRRINRAQVALLLNKFPSEVDDQPYQDIADVMSISKANNDIELGRAKQARKRHGKRR